MAADTAAASSKRDCANEPRYSFTDFDSTIAVDVAGTSNDAIATAGLPCGSSHVSSNAVQTSAPVKGSAPAMPISSRCGARGTGNSSFAS